MDFDSFTLIHRILSHIFLKIRAVNNNGKSKFGFKIKNVTYKILSIVGGLSVSYILRSKQKLVDIQYETPCKNIMSVICINRMLKMASVDSNHITINT